MANSIVAMTGGIRYGRNMTVTLLLPDDIAALKGLGERDLKREMAIALYADHKLTLVQAADLAGHGLFEFQSLLRDRHIPQHYNETDLDQDLLVLRELPPL
jgi:predicted HTH domain antitoxin